MGVVQHRVVVDDVQGTRADHLNLRLETAFAIVEFGRLTSAAGHAFPLAASTRYTTAFWTPFRPNPSISGSSRMPPHLDILVRDDLPRRHRVVKDDLAVDLSAARNRARFVGARRYGDRPCEDDRGELQQSM